MDDDQFTLTLIILKLEWHLLNNFYPPHSAALARPALDAIKAAKRGEPDTLINLAESGITHQKWGDLVPARFLIEDLRLEDFVDLEES